MAGHPHLYPQLWELALRAAAPAAQRRLWTDHHRAGARAVRRAVVSRRVDFAAALGRHRARLVRNDHRRPIGGKDRRAMTPLAIAMAVTCELALVGGQL